LIVSDFSAIATDVLERFRLFISVCVFIRWFMMTARDGGMEVIIRETTILDAGYYQCHGKNKFGTASSTPVAVAVHGMFFGRLTLSYNSLIARVVHKMFAYNGRSNVGQWIIKLKV